MSKEDKLEIDGIIVEILPSSKFIVQLDGYPQEHKVTCTISGKMRIHNIRILPGDKVSVEISPYDLLKGRIIYRYKQNES